MTKLTQQRADKAGAIAADLLFASRYSRPVRMLTLQQRAARLIAYRMRWFQQH